MANVIEFTIKGVDRSGPAFASVTRSMSDASKSLAAFTTSALKGVAAVGATAAAVVGFTARMTSASDEAAKISMLLGASVEEFTALRFAANQSGLSAEQFAGGLQYLKRTIGEATLGFGEGSKALRALGLDAGALSKLTLNDQMLLLADAMSGVSDSGERVAIAMQLFGRSGASIIQMLGSGSDAIRTLTADAEKMGAVIGTDAASDAEKLHDSLDRLRTSMGGAGRAIANEWSEAMAGAINLLANAVATSHTSLSEMADRAMRGVIAAGIVTREVFGGLFGDLSRGWGEQNGLMEQNATMWFRIRLFVKNLALTVDRFNLSLTRQFRIMMEGVNRLAGIIPGVGAVTNAMVQGLRGSEEQQRATIRRLSDDLNAFVADFAPGGKPDSILQQMFDLDPDKVSAEVDQIIKKLNEAAVIVPPISVSGAPSAPPPIAGVAAPSGATASVSPPPDLSGYFDKIQLSAIGAATAVGESNASIGNTSLSMYDATGQRAIETFDQINLSAMNTAAALGEINASIAESSTSMYATIGQRAAEYFSHVGTFAQEMGDVIWSTAATAIDGIANAIGQAVAGMQSFGDALKAVFQQIVASVVAGLVKIGLQMLVQAALQKAMLAGQTAATLVSAKMLAAAWAPAAAGASVATLGGAGGAGAAGLVVAYGAAQTLSVVGPAAAPHGGMEYVPRESTYFLDRGERVLSPRQNKDLTQFLAGGGSGGGGLTVNGGVTIVMQKSITDLTPEEVTDALERTIYPGMERLAARGKRPVFLERGR